MGTWGTGLYSNDIAEDVRDICKEIFPFVSVKEGNSIILNEFRDIAESTDIDNEVASFWYALADWQWRHGILEACIKEKTIELLKIHAGIKEWEETGTAKDVKKRIAVMDRLLEQIQSPQPKCKISKKQLKKPKHKLGDIIVFRANNNEDMWGGHHYYHPFVFASEKLFGYCGNIPKFSACDKYMAVLCVGSIKQQHSVYLPDMYDENSIYVFFDYCSEAKPTLDELYVRGFAPYIQWELKDFNRNITDYIGWVYVFTTDDRFRVSESSGINEIWKEFSLETANRYKEQFQVKNYLLDVPWHMNLHDVYQDCWKEKIYAQTKGESLDTLIKKDVYNPQLLQPKELDEKSRAWMGAYCTF